MAFLITHKVSSGTSTDNTVFTTASISVSPGDLVIAFLSSGTAAATTPLPTSLGGTLALAWAMAGDVIMNSSSVGRTSAWWADAGAGATGTVSFNFGATQSNCQWTIVTITGADNANPIVQVDTLRTAATNPSMPISPAPAASSMVIGALGANVTTVPTAGSGWTIIGTGFSAASPALRQTVQYDLDAPGSTFNFTLASSTNKQMIALELNPAPAAVEFSGWGVPI